MKFFSVWAKLLRPVIFYTPPVLLLFWGGAYLWSLVQTLAAPGSPVEMDYGQGDARLRLRADSYTLDLSNGTLQLSRFEARNARGERVATLESLEADGLSFFRRRKINVQGEGLFLRLERDEAGQFPLLRSLIREPQTQPSEHPFEGRVRDVELLFVDRAGSDAAGRPTQWERRTQLPELRFAGGRGGWMASGQATITEMGRLDLLAQSVPDEGLLITGSTPKLELGEALRHFLSTSQGKSLAFLRGAQVREINVSGPVRVFLPAGESLRLESRLELAARQLIVDGRRVDEAGFEGTIHASGARGVLRARDAGLSARLDGAVTWDRGFTLGGRLHAEAPDAASLPEWAKPYLPPSLGFDRARYEGWAAYTPETGFQLDGGVQAQEILYESERFSAVSGTIHASPRRAWARIEEALWAGAPIRGTVAAQFKERMLAGGLFTHQAPLDKIAAHFGQRGIAGSASASLLLAGTLDDPAATLQTRGDVAYRAVRAGNRRFEATFQGEATLKEGVLSVQRLALSGNEGIAAFQGRLDLSDEDPSWNGELQVRQIALEAFDTRLEGLATFGGRVSGPLQAPVAEGRLETYGFAFEGQEIPIVVADLRLSQEGLLAPNVEAVRGSAKADGRLALDFSSGALDGQFQVRGFSLSELLGERAAGLVALESFRLGGTLAQPEAQGRVSGQDLVVENRRVDSLEATVSLQSGVLSLEEAQVRLAGGRMDAQGLYSLNERDGTFQVVLNGLAIERLLPASDAWVLEGTLTGEANGRFSGSTLESLVGEGRLSAITLNGTPLGNGPWNLSADERSLRGDLQIGSQERFIELAGFRYAWDDRTLGGELTAYQIPLVDLVQVAQDALPPTSRTRLASLRGTLNANAKLGGTSQNPLLDVPLLEISDIALGEHPLGTLVARFSRTGEQWNLSEGTLEGPVGSLSVTGTLEEKGEIKLDGEFANIDLDTLRVVDPSLDLFKGKADLAFLVSGETRSPKIEASLRSDNVSVQNGAQRFSLLLDTIEITESRRTPSGWTGGLQAQGAFFYQGIRGDLDARIPFRYPFEIPEDVPIQAQIVVPERDLQEFASFVPSLDPERTAGRIEGRITLGGTRRSLRAEGAVQIQAEKMGFQSVPTRVEQLNAALRFDSERISLHAEGAGSDGGRFALQAESALGSLAENLKRYRESGEFAQFLNAPVTGTLTLDALQARYSGGKRGSGAALLNGEVDLEGTLNRPLLAGNLSLGGVRVTLPSETSESLASGTLPLNPRFEIHAALADPAVIESGTGRFAVLGGGSLTGRLSAPQVNASFAVQEGTIRLPTARVAIEPGGRLRLRYEGSETSDPVARMDVDLEGHTSLTTLRNGDQLERYDITLVVRGNLLETGGLTLSATSDPPDLSQERILALLGQTDLIAGVVGGTAGEQQIREALTGIAVPYAFEALTGGFAREIGLDYLGLEYNLLRQTSLTFAKSLGKGFILQGSRQISDARPGEALRYDVRLRYRLPFREGVLNRISISFGADEERPWKLGLEYNTRF